MRLEAADDKAVWDMLMQAFTEAEDAARHVKNLVAGIDKDIQDLEENAKAAEAGACGGASYQCPDQQPNLELAKEFRAQARALKTMRHSYQPLDADEETEYTYAQLKSLAATKRRAADAEQRKLDNKQAEIDRLQDRLIQAEEDTKMAEEAAATAEEVAGEIQDLLDPLEESLEEWQGVITASASATESAKAKQVLDLLALNTQPAGIFLPTDAIADLDTMDHVFARASNKPAVTMTFEDIANGNDAWVYHRRSFLNSAGNAVDDDAHAAVDWQREGQTTVNLGGTGLPRNHPAIALSGLDTTVFVQQDGTSPAHAQAEQRLYFHHGKLNGIDGTLYCDRVQGCSTYTKSSQTVFLDGWYFTPDVHDGRQESLGYNPAEASFEDSDNDGTYEVVSYVDYGMWLEGPDDALKLHRRAGVIGPQVPTNFLAFFTEGSIPPDLNATYNGKARGLSARKRGAVYASGHFEADVELVATFGYQVFQPDHQLVLPNLSGTIDNFRAVPGKGSGHVDTGWSIRLQPAAINPASGVVTAAYAKAGSLNNPTGGWNATAYGATRNERPDGFYGGFNTMFCDGECNAGRTNVVGAAVGVYSAEK